MKRELRKLIPWILQKIEAPFHTDKPSPDCYGPEKPDHPYTFWPNHPVQLGKGVYSIDKKNKRPAEEEPCRKESLSHKALLPGNIIF